MLELLSALAKALLYAGALTSAGLILAATSLQTSGSASLPLIRRLVSPAAALALTACLAWLLFLFYRLGGEASAPLLSALFISTTGLWGALLCSASLALVLGGRSLPVPALLGGALLLLAGFGVNGHVPALGALGSWQGVVAFVHVAAAAWWLGALVLLHRASARLDTPALGALVHRFGRIALFGIGALLLAGTVMIVILIDLSAKPWLSLYWQLLAAKIALVLCALALAAYNRLKLTPRLRTGDAAAASALRQTISAEIALIALALIVMASLTSWTSPHG